MIGKDQAGIQSDQSISDFQNALKTRDHKKLAVLANELIALKPINASLLNECARALLSIGQPRDAEQCLRVILRLGKKFSGVWTNLGVALKQQERIAEAILAFEKELEQFPNMSKTLSNLAGAYSRQGRHEEAIAAYRRAIAQDPADPMLNSNMLLSLQYVNSISPRKLLAEHRAWAERHAAAALASTPAHANAPNRDRPLRIGYVSADLRTHPVAFFIGPVLAAHDRTQVSVYCYASNSYKDALTQNLRAHADAWRDISNQSDDACAALIRQDSIDILVDLSGHTARNRLMLFARKPAPLQVTYLGYPGTTGLSSIDYRLTDTWADPPGSSETLHSETLVRIPSGFLCYRAPDNAPAIGPLPAASNGYVTFASFNNSAKLSQPTIELWSKILRALPGSRLLLKSSFLGDAETQRYFYGRFERCGVDADRIDMQGRTAGMLNHLRMYGGVDIALDPTPYCGTTTTCEALWMGVPVITLSGDRHSGRVGVSLLSVTGLTDFIARNHDQYVQIAQSTAQNLTRLEKLRKTLRRQVRQSPLCESKRLARALEQAYRAMWHRWCDR